MREEKAAVVSLRGGCASAREAIQHAGHQRARRRANAAAELAAAAAVRAARPAAAAAHADAIAHAFTTRRCACGGGLELLGPAEAAGVAEGVATVGPLAPLGRVGGAALDARVGALVHRLAPALPLRRHRAQPLLQAARQ